MRLEFSFDFGAWGGLRSLSLTLSLKGEGTVRCAWMFWRQPAIPEASI